MRDRSHKQHSLCARLTFQQTTCAVALTVILGCSAATASAWFRRRDIDRELVAFSGREREALQSAEASLPYSLGTARPNRGARVSPTPRLQILTLEGGGTEAVDQAGAALPVTPAALSALATAQPRWETLLSGNDEELRVLDTPVAGGGPVRTYVLRAALPLEPLADARGTRVIWLIVVLALFAATQASIGWFINKAALRPLEKLANDADHLVDSLNGRVPVAGGYREVQRLSHTVNRIVEAWTRRMHDTTSELAHEIRQPLTAIRGGSELALRNARSEDDYRRALERNLSQADIVENIVLQMSTDARETSEDLQLKTRVLNLSEMARTAVAMMSSYASAHGVKLEVAIPEEVDGPFDAAQIYRLLLNLIENAIKYNRASGIVHVGVNRERNLAIVTVRDTGVGIAQDEIPHLFARNYRAPLAEQSDVAGSGLGLFLAEAVAKRHGGSIDVSSTPGEGSTFRVFLPCVPPEGAAASL